MYILTIIKIAQQPNVMSSFLLRLVITREPTSICALVRIRTLSRAWKLLLDDECDVDNPWRILYQQSGFEPMPSSLSKVRIGCFRHEKFCYEPLLYDKDEIRIVRIQARAPARAACRLSADEIVWLRAFPILVNNNMVRFRVDGVSVSWRRDGSVYYYGGVSLEQFKKTHERANAYMSSLLRRPIAAKARVERFSVLMWLRCEYDFDTFASQYSHPSRLRDTKLYIEPVVSKGHRLHGITCVLYDTGNVLVTNMGTPKDIERAREFLEMMVSNQLVPSKFRVTHLKY